MDWNRYWLDRTAREMALRNYAASTQECYLAASKAFLTHHRCAPSGLRPDAIGRYLLLCKEDRGLNPSSVNLILAALVFFYQYVVKELREERGPNPARRIQENSRPREE